MNCTDIEGLLEEYETGEMDITRKTAMENHFDTCPACRRKRESYQTLRVALTDRSLYRRAPDSLRQRIARTLGEEAPARTRPSGLPFLQFAPAFGLALVAFLIGGVLRPFPEFVRSAPTSPWISEAVSSHVRSLQVDHLMDVVSTDQHTVKPWFNGKLDFTPPVIDGKEQGYPLIGGRLDVIEGRTVAALVYHRHKHVINLLIRPSADGETRESKPNFTVATTRGYHLIFWKQADMDCVAVSDVNAQELATFAHLIAGVPTPAP